MRESLWSCVLSSLFVTDPITLLSLGVDNGVCEGCDDEEDLPATTAHPRFPTVAALPPDEGEDEQSQTQVEQPEQQEVEEQPQKEGDEDAADEEGEDVGEQEPVAEASTSEPEETAVSGAGSDAGTPSNNGKLRLALSYDTDSLIVSNGVEQKLTFLIIFHLTLYPHITPPPEDETAHRLLIALWNQGDVEDYFIGGLSFSIEEYAKPNMVMFIYRFIYIRSVLEPARERVNK
eukprot:sb/3469352/